MKLSLSLVRFSGNPQKNVESMDYMPSSEHRLENYITNPRSESLLSLTGRREEVLGLMANGKEDEAKLLIIDRLDPLIFTLTLRFNNTELLKLFMTCQSFDEVYLLVCRLLPKIFESAEDVQSPDEITSIMGDLVRITIRNVLERK